MSTCKLECNSIDAGCFSPCADIVLPFKVPSTGIYLLEFTYKGSINYVKNFLKEGENFRFSNTLNETFNGEVRIIDDHIKEYVAIPVYNKGGYNELFYKFKICIKNTKMVKKVCDETKFKKCKTVCR